MNPIRVKANEKLEKQKKKKEKLEKQQNPRGTKNAKGPFITLKTPD